MEKCGWVWGEVWKVCWGEGKCVGVWVEVREDVGRSLGGVEKYRVWRRCQVSVGGVKK